MFASQVKYKTVVRLAVKAWMMFVETGSLACKKAWERMIKLAKSLRVPSGPARAQLWMLASLARDRCESPDGFGSLAGLNLSA